MDQRAELLQATRRCIDQLAACNVHLHELSHRAGGVLMAARIRHGTSPLPEETAESFDLVRGMLATSDELLRLAHEALVLLCEDALPPGGGLDGR